MEMKKKGVSPIIAEILLVLITIAAIGIVAGFVVPFVQNTLTKSTECTNYGDYFKFQEVFNSQSDELRYNCRDATDNLYGISVKAGSDSTLAKDIEGMKIVWVGAGSSKSVEIDDGAAVGDILKMMDRSKTSIEIPGAGEARSYVYSSSENYQQAEVYPLLKSGRTCEKTDTITLVSCADNVIKDVSGSS